MDKENMYLFVKNMYSYNVAIKDKVWVLYRRINHKLPGGIMDEARQGWVHYGRMFVIYSTIQYSNQVLYCYIIKTGVILKQKRLFFSQEM